MSEVFYLRPIDPPIGSDDVQTMAQHAGGCFDLHHVDWKHSFLAVDGARMLCWYGAPDAESARLALRQLGSDMNAVWTGTVIGDVPDKCAIAGAGVLAEIHFDAPLAREELASRTRALERQGVALVCGFVSTLGTRLVCLFQSNGVDAVRSALTGAELPADDVWACTPITPFADRHTAR
jgi:hypothetical protein